MHQIKIFKGIESEVGLLEESVNKWLLQNEVKVIGIQGNMAPQSYPTEGKNVAIAKGAFAPSDIVIIVHYERL